MKTRTEQEEIAAETITRTFYGCDFCEYETEDEDDLKVHHGKTHAAKKEIGIGDTRFYWFDSKEDAELWLRPPEMGSHIDYTEVTWEGPGWYGHDTTMGRGRCRCGNCEYFEATLKPIATFIDNWRTEITNREAKIAIYLKQIEAAKNLSPAKEN